MTNSPRYKTKIEIPTAKLIQDISEGKIELRNPQQDLPHMLRGVLESRGWKVCLRVEASLWFRTALWIFPNHITPSYGRIPVCFYPLCDITYDYMRLLLGWCIR